MVITVPSLYKRVTAMIVGTTMLRAYRTPVVAPLYATLVRTTETAPGYTQSLAIPDTTMVHLTIQILVTSCHRTLAILTPR